ncbi:hypothetical protein Tco_0794662 [Tanacetum coccineum]
MVTLKFADSHNMVAFLSKPTECEGFEHIVDFLNAHTIKYALTINHTIYTSCIEQFWATIKAKTINGEVQLQALVDGKKVVITESTIRRDLQLEDAEGVDYEAVYKDRDDSLVRATTTASSLEAEQDSGNINKTRSKATLNELSSLGTSSGVNTPRSDEDSLKLKELMELCTNLKNRFLALETTKTTQANEIDSLKRRVKKLEKKDRKRTHKLERMYKVGLSARVISSEDEGLDEEDASKQERIADIDAAKDIYLINDQRDEDMFGVNDLDGDEVVVETKAVPKDVNLSVDEVTLAQALATLKSTKSKADKVMIQEPEQGMTTPTTAAITPTPASTRPMAKGIVIHEQEQAPTPMVSSQQPSQVKVKDKGKGKIIKPEPVKKFSKKNQLRLDKELDFKLQAEQEEKERLAREKDEANVALTEEWNDIQAKIETDYELAQRLQAEEQEELTIDEKATLFQQLLEKRRKHFASKRAEEKRNRPPIKAQQRSIMCTYLKNMEGWKPKELKNKSVANDQELFNKAFKRVNTFVDFRTELVEGIEIEESSKKVEVMEESSKRAEIA